MPFIPRQYSWDYRHEHKRKNNMLHSFAKNLLSQSMLYQFDFFSNSVFAYNFSTLF